MYTVRGYHLIFCSCIKVEMRPCWFFIGWGAGEAFKRNLVCFPALGENEVPELPQNPEMILRENVYRQQGKEQDLLQYQPRRCSLYCRLGCNQVLDTYSIRRATWKPGWMPGTGSMKDDRVMGFRYLRNWKGETNPGLAFCVKRTVVSTSWLPWVSSLDLRVVLVLMKVAVLSDFLQLHGLYTVHGVLQTRKLSG